MAKRLKSLKTYSVKSKLVDPDSYEHDRLLDPGKIPFKSFDDILESARRGEIQIDARVMAIGPDGPGIKALDTKAFVEAHKRRWFKKDRERLKEADPFLTRDPFAGGFGLVGEDYTPLLGGPFNKQLYLQDYLQAQSQCFFALHHDPVARALVQITRDFTLGRGFKVKCQTDAGQLVWNSFEKANKLQERMQACSMELSTYGEVMWWKLPNMQTKMAYQVSPGQEPPIGLIPRVRLIDPGTVWDILCYPEDIERILGYMQVFPTQYQLYTDSDAGSPVPGSKYVYQQIPAEQVMHYKVNVVSNEKRGRSDLFPVLGYLKRLRDSVNYEIVKLQKQAAWAIDTTIDGDPSDLNTYAASQQALGTIPQAGSEFIHSKAVTRQMLENTGSMAGAGVAFEWCLSMCCIGAGIPVHYMGSHLSNASTKASAYTATEPVMKKFENRRELYKRMLTDMSEYVFKHFGVEDQIDVTFPELVASDRSAKLKDLALAESEGWISKERAATSAAKELGFENYDWETEKTETAVSATSAPSPLTSGSGLSTLGSGKAGKDEGDDV